MSFTLREDPESFRHFAEKRDPRMLHITAATDKGLVREVNEDSYAGEVFSPTLGYGVVCDGMGGEAGGSVASRVACEEIRRMIDSSLRPGMDDKSLCLLLQTAAENANLAVYDRSRQDDGELAGMGCTLCLALVDGAEAHIVSAGDSRCYLLRDGELEQLTTDHTLVQMMVDRGEITPEQAATHPDKRYITRAVGVSPRLDAPYRAVELREGDALLLCSDGLYNMVPEKRLAVLTARCAERDDAAAFVAEANAAGGEDNITAIVIHTGGKNNG